MILKQYLMIICPAIFMRLNVAAAVVGGSIVSGAMGASSAKSASRAQQRAADAATEEQRRQFDITQKNNAQFLKTGTQANNRLAYLLGLNAGGTSSGQGSSNLTYDQLRSQLLPQFTTNKRVVIGRESTDPGRSFVKRNIYGNRQSVNEDELNAEINKRLQQQTSAQSAAQSAQNDPAYGSLLRPFSQSDLDADPIYNNTIGFALDQGTQGINRQAAASGSLLSGATLKALSRFGANTAATYGNDAFNRKNVTDTNTYNRLAGVSGAGQQAVNQVSAAGQNMANNVSNNLIGAGNARGASAIAQGNALSGALQNGFNNYQQSQLYNSLSQNSPYAGTGYTGADINGLSGYQGIY